VLVEAAWAYRVPARKTAYLQRRAQQTSEAVQAIAWKAQKRLCGRYQHLLAAGKLTVQACTAVARELAGFLWAIACEGMNPISANLFIDLLRVLSYHKRRQLYGGELMDEDWALLRSFFPDDWDELAVSAGALKGYGRINLPRISCVHS